MDFWKKERICPEAKKILLKAYNAFWEIGPFVKKKYLRLYCYLCRVNPRKVVFSNFFGKPYGDNPKYIAEELLNRCPEWDLVWLASDVDTPLPKGIRAVRFGSNQAMKELASAKYLVVNIRNIHRPKKKKGQVLLQTWHGGLGFKKVEGAVTSLSPSYVKMAQKDGRDCNAIISSCGAVSEIYREHFWLNQKTKILEIGLPRNDTLFDEKAVGRAATKVRDSFGINAQKKMVLYMPTFRDDNSVKGYALDFEGVKAAFEQRFGHEFVLLVRFHPNVQEKTVLLDHNMNVYNATSFADAQELLMAADYLITDYSSAAFDFALLKRPVFLCALDYKEYCATRGLTRVYEECPFDRSFSNEELIENIKSFSLLSYETRMKEFTKLQMPFDCGSAAKQAVDWILTQ